MDVTNELVGNVLINDIHQVFIDYFGEDNVDLQVYSPNTSSIEFEYHCGQHAGDYLIIVHWNSVTITNEYDESIDIWDLYGVSIISPEGCLRRGPAFTRSTYDIIQWDSGYCHSHLPSLSWSNCQKFKISCLGSGPIRSTIDSLSGRNHSDLDLWRLYCWELDKYVHVESLAGGPYMRLREVGKHANSFSEEIKVSFKFPFISSRICKKYTTKLTNIILDKDIIKYNYINGRYLVGDTYPNLVLDISNAFIEWYNSVDDKDKDTVEELRSNYFLEDAFIQGGCVINSSSSSNTSIIDIGRQLFIFKGNPVLLQLVSNETDYDTGTVTIVNLKIIDFIIYNILNYMNVNYGKPTDTTGKKTRIF